jgi:hypothetical protein
VKAGPEELPDIRKNILDLEHRMTMAASQLEWDTAVRALATHPAWEHLKDRMRTLLHSEMDKFLKTRMEPYEVGRFQGTLWALRMAVQDEPLPQHEVDELRSTVTLLRDELIEQRRLLE